MAKIAIKFAAFLASLALAACATRVKRVENERITDLSGNWNDTDARFVSAEIINDALSRPWLSQFMLASNNRQPIIAAGLFSNDTSEHLDTDILVQEFERAMLNSGKARIVANSKLREILRNERRNRQAGMEEEAAKAAGRELGADLMFFGSVKLITDRIGSDIAKSYQVDARLINIQTNEVVWIGNSKQKKTVDQKKTRW